MLSGDVYFPLCLLYFLSIDFGNAFVVFCARVFIGYTCSAQHTRVESILFPVALGHAVVVGD